MTQRTSEESQLNPLFIKAAGIIIDRFKKPDSFILFTNELTQWVHRYEIEKKDHLDSKDKHFEATLLIEHIALPWLEGGKKMVAEMAKGIAEIYDCLGYEGFHDALGSFLIAYGKSYEAGISDPEKYAVFEMKCFLALTEVSDCLFKYDQRRKEETQVA